MLIHSAGGEVRLMKMHVFPELFHLHQMIHPALLLSNINEIKSTFTKCMWPRPQPCLPRFSGWGAASVSVSLQVSWAAGENWGSEKGKFCFEDKQLFANDCRMIGHGPVPGSALGLWQGWWGVRNEKWEMSSCGHSDAQLSPALHQLLFSYTGQTLWKTKLQGFSSSHAGL